jgi:hypothetical protein
MNDVPSCGFVTNGMQKYSVMLFLYSGLEMVFGRRNYAIRCPGHHLGTLIAAAVCSAASLRPPIA